MKCTRRRNNCFRCGPEHECIILAAMPKRQPCSFYKPALVDYDTGFIKADYDGIWKRVRGWDGKYWVSSNGEVLGQNETLLKQTYYKGRPCVAFHLGESAYRQYVDELVADAFLPGRGGFIFRDGNSFNCKADNLERR